MNLLNKKNQSYKGYEIANHNKVAYIICNGLIEGSVPSSIDNANHIEKAKKAIDALSRANI